MQIEPSFLYQGGARVKDFLREYRPTLATLMFTDIIGSVNLKRQLGDLVAGPMIQRHHDSVRELLATFETAKEIETAGDSFLLIFEKPSDAVRFALQLQRRLRQAEPVKGLRIQDRIGIHAGEVFLGERDGSDKKDLYGIQVDACARVAALGGGDQILITQWAYNTAYSTLLGHEPEGFIPALWVRHGFYDLKGVGPVEICEVGEEGHAVLRPPPNSPKATRCEDEHLKRGGWRPAKASVIPHTQWVIQDKLGEGGFGEVWKAVHSTSGELSAFKFSFREDGRHWLEQSWKTYESLVKAGGDLTGVVTIEQSFLLDQPYALRLEYVEGLDLAAWCAKWGDARKIPLNVRVEIIAQLASALQQAHAAGVTHKDLKPSNVLVTGPGQTPADVRVKLTDFGAWLDKQMTLDGTARTTTLIGSPLYLSPEQARGELKLTPASDIYALGAILYELLTGRPPFVRASFSAVLDAHRHEEPSLPTLDNPGVPDALQRICLKAMAKRLVDRYTSIQEMAADLCRFVRGERVVVRPPQYDNFMADRIRRHLSELAAWRKEKLLTNQEFARLAGAYSPFARAGLEAVMESRRVHLSLMMLLLGGWLILDGSSLWLKTQWPILSAWQKIGIGWLPVLVTNGLWALFWRKGSYRAGHIMMLLGAISLPFGIGVLLQAMHWLEVAIGKPSLPFDTITNAQQLVSLVVAVAWTAVLGWRTRTVSVSALAVILTLLAYMVWLDFGDLSELVDKFPAWLALCTLPMALLALIVGAALARPHSRQRRQAIPWFAAALVLLIAVTLTIAWKSPEEWILNKESRQHVVQWQGFLIACCAAIYFPAGILLRHRFLVHARVAYNTLLCLAPLCLLFGVAFMANPWPKNWPMLPLFGRGVCPAYLVLGLLSIGCVILAAKVQLRFYAFAGLTFLTLAEWQIGDLYFKSHDARWALLLLLGGNLLTAWLVAVELRKRRPGAPDEMDDVVEQICAVAQTPARSPAEEDPLHN
jgi:serine/threonine protein kinase/class 3 adenylate cyclase